MAGSKAYNKTEADYRGRIHVTFDWIDYLNLASDLENEAKCGNSLGEAKRRTSISRAYYSSFNLAKNYLISTGVTFNRSSEVHKEVQFHFEDLSRKEKDSNKRKNLIEISNELGNLRSARNKADYNDTLPRVDKLGQASLIRARKIESLVKSLSSFF